jgi:hypothetical protein
MKTQVSNQFNFGFHPDGLPLVPEKGKIYLKVTNENECHNDYQYKDGLNVDSNPFNDNPNETCIKGRMYFTDLANLPEFASYGVWVREIIVPDDARVICEKNKYGADRLILGKRWSMRDFLQHVQYIVIGGDAWFNNLQSAENCFPVLQSIGGNAGFFNLQSAENCFPVLQSIEGDIYSLDKVKQEIENIIKKTNQ